MFVHGMFAGALVGATMMLLALWLRRWWGGRCELCGWRRGVAVLVRPVAAGCVALRVCMRCGLREYGKPTVEEEQQQEPARGDTRPPSPAVKAGRRTKASGGAWVPLSAAAQEVARRRMARLDVMVRTN